MIIIIYVIILGVNADVNVPQIIYDKIDEHLSSNYYEWDRNYIIYADGEGQYRALIYRTSDRLVYESGKLNRYKLDGTEGSGGKDRFMSAKFNSDGIIGEVVGYGIVDNNSNIIGTNKDVYTDKTFTSFFFSKHMKAIPLAQYAENIPAYVGSQVMMILIASGTLLVGVLGTLLIRRLVYLYLH